MSIRCILVPITGHPADRAVLETVGTLAAALSAHIAVACLRPDPTAALLYTDAWSAPSMIEAAMNAAESSSRAVGQRARAMFDKWRALHGLPLADGPSSTLPVSVSWAEYIGSSAGTLSDIARFSDLVAMRTLGDKGPIDGDLMLEALLFDVGRPVMLVPNKTVDPLAGGALIAWDGGHEALRAVVDAMPMLRLCKTVQILTVETTENMKSESLAVYLGWHGIAATVSDTVRGSKSIGDVVLKQSKQAGASLLVMGGYHHGRTRELLFGGTTRRVIGKTTTPVLLAH